MTKTVHFHVGSGRCGSTLIQSLFTARPVLEVLLQGGIQHDNRTYQKTAPLLPAEQLRKQDWIKIRREHFRRPLEQGPDNLFVTQENAFGVRYGRGQKNVCDASCDIIEFLTEGFRAHIVIILRRQDTFVESLYVQQVKRMETRDFDTYLAEFPLDNIAWDTVVDTYAERFGRENVTVIPFERPVVQSGGRRDFIDALLKAIGLPFDLNLPSLPVANPSMSARALELQHIANRTLSQDEAFLLADWLSDNIGKRPEDPHNLMSDDDRTRILARFREGNRRLFERYMADYDPAYFTAEQ